MKEIDKIGWLDGFGTSKDYRCYALSCPADILFCVRMLETTLHWNCVFVNELMVSQQSPELKGKMFLSEIDRSKNAFIYLLPNKYPVPRFDAAPADIFSEVEMQADYYLFSKRGDAMFKCKSVGYEYLLLLSADKGFNLKPVEDGLLTERRLPTENLSDLILQKTTKGGKVMSFLQQLFVSLELVCRNYYGERVGEFLGDVRQLDDSNYPYVPFFQMDLDVNDQYLSREDI